MEKKKNKKQNNFSAKKFWLNLWRLLSSVHGNIKAIFFGLFIVECVNFIGPYLLKLIIDALGRENIDTNLIFLLILGMFIAYQTLSFLSYTVDSMILKVLLKGDKELMMNSFGKMIYLHLGFHEKESSGSKISKIDRGVSKIDDLISSIGWEVGPTMIQIMLTLAILYFTNWKFGLIVTFFMPIFIWLTLFVNRINFPKRIKRYDYYEDASGQMIQSVININTVKSFVQEEREYNKLEGTLEKGYKIHREEFGNIIKANIARNIVINLGRALILLSGLGLVLSHSLSIGSLVFVYTISEKALLSLFRITRLYDRIMDSSEAVERLHQLANEEIAIKSPRKGLKLTKVAGEIVFENVSFKYANNQESVLENINAKILPDSVTALVGPSGGGKTTFVRMIFRHYDPTKGKILFDGHDLRELDLFDFRRNLAIVPQEVEIFNLSIKENIAYAKPNASMAEIQAAARIANAEEFILKLSDGYKTLVGERGIKLSGGQRQRIGIARAVLANPKVLVFDEATSSLDSYSESLIQQALGKICKNRTVILIAHRLSTIQKADKILVLENGRIIEEGNHAELSMKKGGLYRKLINLQHMGDVE